MALWCKGAQLLEAPDVRRKRSEPFLQRRGKVLAKGESPCKWSWGPIVAEKVAAAGQSLALVTQQHDVNESQAAR